MTTHRDETMAAEARAESHSSPVVLRLCQLALAIGVTVWIIGALRQSLWLDEFHSLSHADQPTLSAFIDSVRRDNHPPLYFSILRCLRQWGGESHLLLRLPSLVAGLGILVLLWRSSPRGTVSGPLAAALFALSSYALVLVVDARMYALLALCVVGMWFFSLRSLTGKRGRFFVFVFCVLGLHTHYYFFHYAGMMVAALVLTALLQRSKRKLALQLMGAMAASLIMFVPWFVLGMREQLSHSLAPGRTHTHWSDFPASLLHFFFMDVGSGGSAARVMAAIGMLTLLPLAFFVLRRFWKSNKDERSNFIVTTCVALGAPLLAFVMATLMARAGYNWKYIAGSAPLSLVLLASAWNQGETPGRIQRGAIVVLFVMMTAVTLCSAWDRGREDHFGALRSMKQDLQESDQILISPTWFPNGRLELAAFEHYAPQLGFESSRAVSIEVLGQSDWRPQPRIWVLMRGAMPDWARSRLMESHHEIQRRDFGQDLSLYRFDVKR